MMSDFLRGFCAPARSLAALTPAATACITGLDFQPTEGRGDLPSTPGVYIWVDWWTGPSYYVGSATSRRGLRGRVGDEFEWRHKHSKRLATGDPLDTGAATRVP